MGEEPGDAGDIDGGGEEAGEAYRWAPEEGGCNGRVALCDRRYDEVATVTTHNAMASEARGFFGPNQRESITDQLLGGVRGLMLDTHDDEGVASLCHGVCLAGRQPLVEGLGEIRAFLDANPREVVTIIFESGIGPELTLAAMEESGLMAEVYAHAGGSWPTLGSMIERGERLVLFTDSGGQIEGPYLDVWAHAWETHYSARTAADFSCAINRGSMGNALFIFNHFLTNPIGRADLAERVNHNPLLIDRVRGCQEEAGRRANFITVDFYSIGDVLEVVDALNAD